MMNKLTHIEVAVPLPVFHTYTYAVPAHLHEMIEPGKRVLVPFGRRKVTGYIIGLDTPVALDGIKEIIEILDEAPLFPPTMIPFLKWMADYYIHPIGEVISEALPGGINVNERITLHITEAGACALSGDQTTGSENDVLQTIQASPCRLGDVCKKLNRDISSSLICQMERKGLLTRRRELRGATTRPKTERYARLSDHAPPCEGLTEKQRAIIDHIRSNGEASVNDLKQYAATALNLVRTLEKKGYLTLFDKKVYRDPFGEAVEADSPPKLTLDQKIVMSEVNKSIGNGFSTYLLAGVTGSGKTEVYMQAAAEALNQQYTVLILVPEIALTSEMERRFRCRFGDCVAVLHSGLSSGERLDQWVRIANSETPIVIGARSAIFAPLTRIGLIIVDEEHDTSYKQESRFRYNARDMAIVRARQEGAMALLGSATPSIHSIYNVVVKKFHELNLKKRIHKQALPEVSVVDLREHKDYRGMWRFITPALFQSMKETLARKEQVLIFLNRRGFATFPVCAGCGQTFKCRHCEMTLTLHQKAKVYKCHLCGYCLPSSAACPVCGSSAIKQLGLGTEKIEQAIKALFPDARVARMDRDTVTHKDSLIHLLKAIRNHDIDILIGTQMVAKGHDFPRITLVGIICADLSLSFPDFRAGEITFQMLAQVAGRAGRGEWPGRVILQTYNPDHFSIAAAKNQDFMEFYKQEIIFRKTFRYPPFSRMILLKISGRNAEKTKQYAESTGKQCLTLKDRDPQFKKKIEVLGPIEAPLSKIAKQYRWQILLKSPGAELLHQFVRKLVFEEGVSLTNKHVNVAIDVDPFFMM